MEFKRKIIIDYQEELLEKKKCPECENDSFEIWYGLLRPVLEDVGTNHRIRCESTEVIKCKKCGYRLKEFVHVPTLENNDKIIRYKDLFIKD